MHAPEIDSASLPDAAPRVARRFVRVALGLWAACLATTAFVQVAADPYDAYGGWSLFDRHRRYAQRDEAKAEALLRTRPDALVLGTSRAMAFDPASPLWGSRRAFNLALPAAPQSRVARAFRAACEVAEVKRVLLCIDFYQYGCDPSPRSFERSRLAPGFSAWRYHTANLFSRASFEAALEVVRDKLSGRASDFTPWEGLVSGRFHTRRPPRELFTSMAEGYAKIYRDYRARREEYDALREIVAGCRERGIELTVVTAPVHAVHLELLASLGMWDDYEAWLRETTEIVHEAGDGAFAMWDFAGYGPYHVEPAPRDDSAPEMRYHQEPAHFTKELAELVLKRVVDAPDAPRDFGVRIAPATIARRLADLRAERLAWLATAPADLACVPRAEPPRLADLPAESRENGAGRFTRSETRRQ